MRRVSTHGYISTRVCLRVTHRKNASEFAKQICAFCAISFSTSFTAFLTPDSCGLLNSLKLLGVVVQLASCSLRWLYPYTSAAIWSSLPAAASFTLIADECLYNKCHTQATRDCRKAFRMHTPWPRILRKSRRHSTPHGSIFDKNEDRKPIRVDI
jgi:hypothetical protein